MRREPICVDPAPSGRRVIIAASLAAALILSAIASAVHAQEQPPPLLCPEASGGTQLCGHATCGDDDVTASDSLLALRTAVGSEECSPCRCDTDASGSVNASDSLRILRMAVGQGVALHCPACNSLT